MACIFKRLLKLVVKGMFIFESGEIQAKVFLVKFWMRHYNSPSMKPSMLITNQEILGSLDLGVVPLGKRKRCKPTTKKYIDGSGKQRYVGTQSLKESQNLFIQLLILFVWGDATELMIVFKKKVYGFRMISSEAKGISCQVCGCYSEAYS